MAPLPPVANVVKATFDWHVGSNVGAQNILHFQYSGGHPSASDCSSLAATFQAALVSELKGYLHTSNSIGQCTVQDIDSNTGAEGFGGTVTAGTLSGSYLGASICAVMNHSIARRYRGGKPRSYLPLGSSSEAATAGTWVGGMVTSVSADFEDFITSCLAATAGTTDITHFVSVSYYFNKALRTTPVVDVISQSALRTRMGSQRRRLKTA